MQQKELISALFNMEVIKGDYLDNEVTFITNDSRNIVSGSCFIAIKGENFNGHHVLKNVIEGGAKIVVVEELRNEDEDLDSTIIKVPSTKRAQAILANMFYQQPSTRLNTIAITGTNGKTTTSNMINQILERLDHKTGLIGTLHNKIGDQIIPTVNTTPDSIKLQGLLYDMVEAGCDSVILEASSHALSLGRLSYTNINCAIYTNLSREHLDFHQTMEKYALAKSFLFSQLGQGFNHDKAKLAIINLDDNYSYLMAEATSADIVTYSMNNRQATVYAHSVISHQGNTDFLMDYRGQTYKISLPMRGSYNIYNFLAAFLCVTCYFDYSPENVINAFQSFQGVTGRMQSINEGQNFEVIVDFAHTTDALSRVLRDIKQNKNDHQNLIVLMGHSGGNRDSDARPELGDILFEYADKIVFTSDNPRYESVKKICQEMIGLHCEKPFVVIEDRIEAINYTINHANDNDILLFAGKGGEPYQVIEDQYIPFNEVDLVRKGIRNNIKGANKWKE